MSFKTLLILSQLCVLSLSLTQNCKGISNFTGTSLQYFEKFGKDYDKKLRQGDDVSTLQDFSFKFKFFDRYYPYVYITNNGICYFDHNNAINHPRPKSFPIKGKNKAMVAPFWSDIDTRLIGDVYYQVRTDDETLKKIGCEIQNAFKSFIHFKPLYALVITYHKVRSYESRFSSLNNTFQLVLSTNAFYSFITFNYGDLNWPTNSSRDGFVAGYNSGDGFTYYMINDELKKVSNLVLDSNVGIPSKWIFRVDSIEIDINNFVKFGTKMEDKLLEKSDEAFVPISLDKEIRISDKLKIKSLFIYSNGFIKFNSPFIESSAIPKKLPILDIAIIFPFWSDINILSSGDIYYREVKDNDSLSQINNDIGNNFTSNWAFVVTYYQVAPHGLVVELNNTFQIILTNGTSSEGTHEFHAIFNYDRISWPNSYFKQSFESGYNLDIDHYYLISQNGLNKNSNVNKSGKYVFRLDRPSKYIEFEAYSLEIDETKDRNSSGNIYSVLIILIILIGLISTFNSFVILWKILLNKTNYSPQPHIIFTKKLSGSTTILMHDEQCE